MLSSPEGGDYLPLEIRKCSIRQIRLRNSGLLILCTNRGIHYLRLGGAEKLNIRPIHFHETFLAVTESIDQDITVRYVSML